VADALGCNLVATLDVVGSHSSFDDISEIHFLENLQCLAQRVLKWSVIFREFTVTCNVSTDNW